MAATRSAPWRTAPWLAATTLALAWLAFGPATPDLAAQVYRSDLFSRVGWTVFDLSWYGGHHMPGYSLLFPPLGALLGVRLVGALAAVASTVLFERIVRRRFGAAARWGALWFGGGSVADLLIGRLTFALGVTVGLGAVYALQRGHRRLVLRTPGLTTGRGHLTRIGPQSFTLRSARAGSTLVRVRYTPYWQVARGHGCVSQTRDGWTLVRTTRPGPIVVTASFDPLRILEGRGGCSDDALGSPAAGL